MTLLTRIKFTPTPLGILTAPNHFRCADVSVIVPVRNNQSGVDRFLSALFETHGPGTLPLEIIIVDNRSSVPVRIPTHAAGRQVPVRLIQCSRRGPASARKAGCAVAQGRWLLFADSDCEPTASFISGFGSAMNGAVGYAGFVGSSTVDRLSRYYESQEILFPPRVHGDRPQYLITANALVWREAFEAVKGFDESYPLAGGEDIDLGFRLSQVGTLSYAPTSVVRHDFGDGYRGFIRRFVRYGRGNRRLAHRYQIDLAPRPFAPVVRTWHNWCAAAVQFICLAWGYWTSPREQEQLGRVPAEPRHKRASTHIAAQQVVAADGHPTLNNATD